MKNFLRIWFPLFALSCLTFSFIACTPPTTGPTCNGDGDCIRGETCRDGICRLSSSGCQSAQDCSAGQICDAGTCRSSTPTCQNQCTDSQTECVGSQIRVCQIQSDGCFRWNPARDCGAGQACQGSRCERVCADACSGEGSRRCADASGYETCSRTVQGCLVWQNKQLCSGGQACKGSGNCEGIQKQEGEPCSLPTDCSSGLLCVLNQQNQGFCRRFCSRSADCSISQACYEIQNGSKVCLPTEGLFPPFDAKCGVLIKNAQITGGSWDPLGGAPDPLVQIDFGGGKIVRTPYVEDTFAPAWNYPTPSNYSYKEVFNMKISLIDSDFDGDQIIVLWDEKGNRWLMNQPRSQDFRLGTTDNSIVLNIQVNCSW